MKFSTYLMVLASAFVVEVQSVSSEKAVKIVDGLTSMSKDLGKMTNSVTLLNGFQSTPEVVDKVEAFTKATNKAKFELTPRKRDVTENFSGSAAAHASLEVRAFPMKEQQAVCNAFGALLKAHQTFVQNANVKHGIFEAVGNAYNMAAALRPDKFAVDALALNLVQDVPSCAAMRNMEVKSLDTLYQKTIDKYANGLP